MAQTIQVRMEQGAYSAIKRDDFGKERLAIFQPVSEDIADVIKGEIPDTEGTPVIYIGDSAGKHYYQSHDLDELDDTVIEAASEFGLTIIDDVDGGWQSWDGRPEFSDSYIDFTESEPVTA